MLGKSIVKTKAILHQNNLDYSEHCHDAIKYDVYMCVLHSTTIYRIGKQIWYKENLYSDLDRKTNDQKQ